MSTTPKNTQSNHDAALKKLRKENLQMRSAIQELNVLNDLAVAAGSELEIDKILDTTVKKSLQALSGEQGEILLLNEEDERQLKTLVRQFDDEGFMSRRVGFDVTGWVLQHQQPLLSNNLGEDERFKLSEQELAGIRNLVCVPIFSKGELLGVLTVLNKHNGDSFKNNDVRLLTIIAAQSGQLIRQRQLQAEMLEKQRLEQELAIARNIQMGLIPGDYPANEKLAIAGFIRTADKVGGDYYDFFELPGGRVAITIADVSGHGPGAALIMTMVKGILHTLTKNEQTPADILHDLNRVLSRIAPPEMFVTMVFAIFDSTNGILEMANAGHHPLFIRKKNGDLAVLHPIAPALNVIPEAEYQNEEYQLASGDTAFVYTDGIPEAFDSEGNMFTEERLIACFRDKQLREPADLVNNIVDNIEAFCGKNPPQDDMAMIVTRFLE